MAVHAHVSRPWEGQQRVREILDGFYRTTPDGLIGNEDRGQMSAWYVFSALGLYQVSPGDPTYVLGAPLFPKATIRTESGRTFVIRSGGGAFASGARLNGTNWSKSWLSHAAVANGA